MIRRSLVLLGPAVDDVVAAYRVMGVPSGADQSVVRARYLELARTHHPDISTGDSDKMKVINTAYELIQSHGHLIPSKEERSPRGDSTRFARKAPRRSNLNRSLTEDEQWMMKSDFDWTTAMEDISEKDLKNPVNHPFSHSKFYTFEDDSTIYRMLRTGATVAQVARTLGKPATFIERRVNNAQFKQRVQILLHREKGNRKTRDLSSAAAQTTVRGLPRKPWKEMSLEERARYAHLYDDEQHSTPERSSRVGRTFGSALGRSYANFERFHQ
jgi:curved DNA-binding protein CbpA